MKSRGRVSPRYSTQKESPLNQPAFADDLNLDFLTLQISCRRLKDFMDTKGNGTPLFQLCCEKCQPLRHLSLLLFNIVNYVLQFNYHVAPSRKSSASPRMRILQVYCWYFLLELDISCSNS